MAPHSATDTEKLQRRNRELSILNAIADALNREVDLTRALHTALAQVAALLDLATGWIWLLRDDTGESYLAASQNLPPALARNPHRMEGSCYCLDTYRAGDMNGAANVNVVTCSRLKDLIDDTAGLRYHASIPLYAHGRRLGVLNVASPDWRELSAADLRLLYTVGDLVGLAIERARLFAKQSEAGAAQERNRLAREIHDTLAQGLAAITLQLETADALLETQSSPDRARQAVTQALVLARANLEEARRSVLDLRAAPLEGRSLAEALQTLCAETSTKAGVPVRFATRGAAELLPLPVEAGLYRIAQEALTNAVQHARPTRVHVELVLGANHVRLVLQDDGSGFDARQIPPGHYGLVGLNERVRLLGGTLHLESSPGDGTRVQVDLPLKGRP
jgi:two-component system NarL family sensor kinase